MDPWSRVLLEKLIVTQLAKNSPPIMEPKGSLPYLKESTNGVHLEPHESSLQFLTLFPQDPF